MAVVTKNFLLLRQSEILAEYERLNGAPYTPFGGRTKIPEARIVEGASYQVDDLLNAIFPRDWETSPEPRGPVEKKAQRSKRITKEYLQWRVEHFTFRFWDTYMEPFSPDAPPSLEPGADMSILAAWGGVKEAIRLLETCFPSKSKE